MLQNPPPRGGLHGVLGGLPMSEGPAQNPNPRVPSEPAQSGGPGGGGGLPYTRGGT